MNLPRAHFEPMDESIYASVAESLPRQKKRILQVITKGSKCPESEAAKSWAFRFLLSPVAFEPNATNLQQLAAVKFEHNRYVGTDIAHDAAKVEGTGRFETLQASLAFRSIGYKSSPLPDLSALGVPFDNRMGIITNDAYGRVINAETGPGSLTAGHVSGFYCAGWVKRGPTGVIASTMDDAFATGDIIARDLGENVPFLNTGRGGSTGLGWRGIEEEAAKKGLRRVSWNDWKRIDAIEKERGRAAGKEREKFSSVREMLEALDS